MQTTTQTRIQIPSQAIPGQSYRVATVTGSPEGCSQVQQMIAQISAEQSSAGVLSGTPMTSSAYSYSNSAVPVGGAATAASVSGDPYAAEWAAYHAAQQAAVTQQQQHNTTTAAHPASGVAASTGTSTEYYEQFFRYAYYYGEEAARAYYKTWSPPIGTPNPYGVNPNGISPAPAPVDVPTASATTTTNTATTTGASTTPQQPSDAPVAKETGRRNVSNLPAWMTQGK